jgi:pyrroloquinoline-quinone synthase
MLDSLFSDELCAGEEEAGGESCMSSIAELRDRARKMYRDIRTPWSTPRFPEPPGEFLPPERFLELVSETVLTHHTKINHPFCVKLVRGEWSIKQLQAWAKQDYHAKVQTLRNDAYIVATAPTLDELREQLKVLISESGEELAGGRYPSHPELWLRFAEGLGLKREEVMKSEPSPLMQVVLDAERYKSMKQSVGDLPANLRVGEKINAVVHPIWAEALRDKYHVPVAALEFFTAHGEADQDHGKLGEQIVLGRAVTQEAQRAIWLHLKKSQGKQWVTYDAFYQAALQAEGG